MRASLISRVLELRSSVSSDFLLLSISLLWVGSLPVHTLLLPLPLSLHEDPVGRCVLNACSDEGDDRIICIISVCTDRCAELSTYLRNELPFSGRQ
ncbi:hypothetical protein A0H81_11437 [Grifola frondosa]|uniref:Uncharacterized protein n=1 Tax=Grifola frondosa TaxID=5627 RepID=A0A1C7LUP3_GRIFR|nr:hypothetical protein A0H81_11437 [Grifola frondosa]